MRNRIANFSTLFADEWSCSVVGGVVVGDGVVVIGSDDNVVVAVEVYSLILVDLIAFRLDLRSILESA